MFNKKGFIRYFANTSWMMGEQMLRLIAGLYIGVWVARYLGPEKYGVFSYVLAFTALFTGFSKLGLDTIVVRELVIGSSKKQTILGTAFRLKLVASLLVFGLIYLILIFSNSDRITNQYIIIIAFGMMFTSFEVVDFYFQSLVLSKYVSICRIIQLSLSSLIKIYLVFTGKELIWFFYITLIDNITLGMTLYLTYRLKKLPSFVKEFDWSMALNLLKASWPLILSSLMVIIYVKIDKIMIKHMLGDYYVGLYSAGIRLPEVTYFIPTIVTNSLFPAIINSKKLGIKIYNDRLQLLYDFLIWIAIAIAVVFSLFSKEIILLVFGLEYLEANAVLTISCWSGIFVFFGVANSKWLISENKSHLILLKNIFGSVVNIVFNLILIPSHGIVGAAYASFISYVSINFLFLILKKELHAQFHMAIKSFLGYNIFYRIWSSIIYRRKL